MDEPDDSPPMMIAKKWVRCPSCGAEYVEYESRGNTRVQIRNSCPACERRKKDAQRHASPNRS
jgi:hypothetical protein